MFEEDLERRRGCELAIEEMDGAKRLGEKLGAEVEVEGLGEVCMIFATYDMVSATMGPCQETSYR